MFKNLSDSFSPFEMVAIFCTTVVATCYVHGTHVKAVVMAAWGCLKGGREKEDKEDKESVVELEQQ